ncbi:hypothetical protein BpHYR1_015079, partial [Brachionus plicatilis]
MIMNFKLPYFYYYFFVINFLVACRYRITYILSQYHSVFVCLEKKKNPDLSKFREKNPKKQNYNLDNFFKIDLLRLHLFLTNGHECFF